MKQRYKKASQVLLKISRFNGGQKIKRLSNPITEKSIMKEIREIANDEEEITKLNESTLLMTRSNFSLSLEKRGKSLNNSSNNKEITEEDIKPSLRRYLTHPIRNLINSVALGYVWMSIAFIYFGMTIGKYIFKTVFEIFKCQFNICQNV